MKLCLNIMMMMIMTMKTMKGQERRTNLRKCLLVASSYKTAQEGDIGELVDRSG